MKPDYYRHGPIDTSKREIRLLRLLPTVITPDRVLNATSDLIECQIFTSSLDDQEAPAYHALSYTWGDANDGVRLISIDGRPFEVRLNLFDALSTLRNQVLDREGVNMAPVERKTLTIWIDAICIDQSNIQEVNAQVAMMRDVYLQAEEVTVWLGIDDDSSRRAFKYIREMSDILWPGRWEKELRPDTSCSAMFEEVNPKVADWQKFSDRYEESAEAMFDMFRREEGIGDPSWNEHETRQRELAQDLEAVAALVKRPYFERMWIVQEVTSGRRVKIWCGSDYIDASRLSEVQAIIDQQTQSRSVLRKHISVMRLMLSDKAYYDRVTRPIITRGLWSIACMRHRLELRRKNLDNVVGMMSWNKATNPRDMVYGLTGLLNACYPDMKIEVDYGKSVTEVYTNFMTAGIEVTGNLSLWRWLLPRKPGLTDLPSWVLDLRTGDLDQDYFDHVDEHLEWAQEYSPDIRVDRSRLSLNGITVGMIDAVSDKHVRSRWDEHELFTREHLSWLYLADLVLNSGHAGYLRVWHAIFGGSPSLKPNVESCYEDSCIEILRHLPEVCLPTAMFDRIASLSRKYNEQGIYNPKYIMWNRKVIYSSRFGGIGIAPAHCEIGDIICLVFGFEWAMVFRPIGAGMYTVIGPCYLDRMPHSEALELLRKGELVPERFTLI